MVISNTSGVLKKFKRTAWRFQVTFQTPLRDLERFVAAILAAGDDWQSSVVVIDEIVFEAKNLKALENADFAVDQIQTGCSISAEGNSEISKLLRAALSDWLDFLFVPMPKPFVIYADHDEYTTFFAASKSNLNRVADSLRHNGFQMVLNYQRKF